MSRNEKVALASDVHPDAHRVFENAAIEVDVFDRKLKGPELAERISDSGATMIGLRSNPALTTEFFKANPQIHAVGNYCVQGKVDADAADKAGATRFNSPQGNARAVGGYVVGQGINLSRGFVGQNLAMQEGKWAKPKTEDAFDHEGEILGIIGMGGVGPVVAARARQYGFEVIFQDIKEDVECEDATRVELNELLATSRFISPHLPLLTATRGLLGAAEMKKMRKDAYIINAARGPIVDAIALREAVLEGRIAGAAIDVHDEDGKPEPGAAGDAYDSILRGVPGVILTSHTAGTTINAARGIATEVSDKLVEFAKNGNTKEAIGIQQYDLATVSSDGSRVMYHHADLPGALAGIEDILRDAGVNISSVHFEPKLRGEDEDGGLSLAVLDSRRQKISDTELAKIQALPFTLRARLIQD
jgi:D-3-phosphoglycerate dehydrogenase